MIIKRIKSFTDEEKKNDNKEDIKSLIGGLGITAGGVVANGKIGKKIDKKFILSEDKKLSRENNKIFERLKKEGEKQGTPVYQSSSRRDGFYHKSRLKKPDKYDKYLKNRGFKSGREGDLIVTSKNADILAHELGHSKYSKRGRAKGIDGAIGRVSHKANIGRAYLGRLGLATSFMTGMNTGSIEEYRKSKGKKDSKLLRHASWGIPVASALPVLVAEGMASRKGLKLLKKAGASKELLKKSKKRLRNSWGTYATSTIASAGSGEVGRVVGKRIMKDAAEYDKKHEEKNKDNKD